MWRVVETAEYIRQSKWYRKKKRQEFDAVLANLNRFRRSLDDGKAPRPFAFGFLHDEPAGVIAIDQRGASTKLAATRLYLYAYIERETVYLLTVGDKRSQNNDVQNCKHAVEAINADPDYGAQTEDEETEDEAEG